MSIDTAAPTVTHASDPASTPGEGLVTVALPPVLARALEEPGVAESLASLLSHTDLIALLVDGVDGLLERSEVIGNSLLEGISELRATVDDNEALVQGRSTATELAQSAASLAGVLPVAAPVLADLVKSGVLTQAQVLGNGLVAGAAQFRTAPVEVAGPLSVLRQFKDPDIRRATSWLLTIAKALGQELNHPVD